MLTIPGVLVLEVDDIRLNLSCVAEHKTRMVARIYIYSSNTYLKFLNVLFILIYLSAVLQELMTQKQTEIDKHKHKI